MLVNEQLLKITDFGTAIPDTSAEGVGAPAFQPPEVARDGKAPSSAKLDIWAAGVTLYTMVTGKYPFEERETVYQMFEEIVRCEYEMPPFVPSVLAGLIRGMLSPDPATRISLEQIVHHPWLTGQEEVPQTLTSPPPISVIPLKTTFTEENLKRFLSDISGEDKFSLIPGDQLDGDEIDETLHVEKPGFWCGRRCTIL